MECKKTIAGDLFEQSTQDPSFLGKVVTGNESWVFAYDPKTKMQSSEWNTSSSLRPRKSRATKSNIKVILVAFFDDEGIVHLQFVPTETSDTAAFYMDVLTLLRESGRQKRPNGRTTGRCIRTTRPVTRLWQFSSSWPETTFRLCRTRPIPQTSHQVTLAFPYAENGSSRTSFRSGGRHQRKRRRETARYQKKMMFVIVTTG
jgi:hypothetical protein